MGRIIIQGASLTGTCLIQMEKDAVSTFTNLEFDLIKTKLGIHAFQIFFIAQSILSLL